MIRLLKYKFKSQLISKSNIMALILISVAILAICSVFKEWHDSKTLFDIAIIDYDNTDMSKDLIDNIKNNKQVNLIVEDDIDKSMRLLSRGKYDVVYEIKKGFQNKLENGEFSNILVANKEVDSTAVKWINDRVSLIVVRSWMLKDIEDRIKKITPDYNMDELRDLFYNSRENNILDVKIHSVKNVNIENTSDNSKHIFTIIWGITILFMIINRCKGIVDDNSRGVISRLSFAGIGKLKYYSAYIIASYINIIIPYTITYLILGNYQSIKQFIVALVSTIVYICCTWIVMIIISRLFTTKKSYMLACQMLFLMSIILGTEMISSIFKFTNVLSKFIPMTWYVKLGI